jgi:hypothetical protein
MVLQKIVDWRSNNQNTKKTNFNICFSYRTTENGVNLIDITLKCKFQ